MAINYLVLSDIHLGHKRNKTIDIIKNLNAYFSHYTNDSQFTSLDILFIAGDLFHRLLDFTDPDVHEVTLWLSRLMGFCSRHDIKLRILEGTPSHDWKQSRVALTVAELSKATSGVPSSSLDFKYIDTLHIEVLKDLGLHILYVPDRWTGSTELTFKQVQDTMKDLSIDQVDIAIMHGAFGYQVKGIPGNPEKHNENDYLSIVRHFINIGHIHTFSAYGKIIAQGSFDRLAHGEEEAKGGVLCTIAPEGDSFAFIENRNAKLFKTVSLRSKDLDRSIATIDKAAAKLPTDAYLRIKATKLHPALIGFDELKLRYPLLNLSKITTEEEAESYLLVDTAAPVTPYTPVTIDKDNIVSLLTEEVFSKYQLSDSQKTLLVSILQSNIT